MAKLSDILGKSGLAIGSSGYATAPGVGVAPPTLQSMASAPGTAQNPSGAVRENGATLSMTDELVPQGTKPLFGPATPPSFAAEIPTTMDATQVAGAMSDPAQIPAIPEQQPFKMNDGSFYNPKTGVSGTTMEEAAGLVPPTTPGPSPTGGPSGTPVPPGETTVVSDDVTETIKSLFPESDTLVKQYSDLRKSSGIEADEAKLAAANKEAADMQAVIDGIEDEVRAQAGGMADESFIAATVADRMRRLMPQINRINANVKSLSANVQSKKDTLTEQLGFSQQDVANARQRKMDIRTGINDMFSTFGSAAFKDVDPSVLSEIEKQAGLPPGSLSAKAKTLEETKMAQKSFDFQVAGGKLLKMDRATGEVVDTGIAVPKDEKTKFEEAIAIAGALKDVSDPDQVLQFITDYSGGVAVETTKKVGDLSDAELGNVIVSMIKAEGSQPTDRNMRNNNPGNIKVPGAGIEEARKRYGDPGADIERDEKGQPKKAADGGAFIKFSSMDKGLQAMGTLLTMKGGPYDGLSLDAALKKWSNGGYGADIVSGQVGTLGGAFTKLGAVPKISANAPKDLSLIANRVASNPKLDEKDRAAFAKNFNALVNSGDMKGALTAAKTVALQALPVAQYNEYQDNNNAGTKLTSLTQGMSQFQSVNPNLYKTILEKGKTLAAASKDPEWLKLMARVEDVQTVLRKTLFGTAVTNRESSTGANLFVDTKNDTLQDMQIKLENLKASATGNAASILNQALGL